jgi:threonyl-tRNA synthetase
MKQVDYPADKLYKIRHSLTHLLAKAVTDLWPEAKPTIGPPTDNGFYYDFDFAASSEASGEGGAISISKSDLKKIQKQMRKLLGKWQQFQAVTVTADEARAIFADNEYKLELIDTIETEESDITIYYSGPDLPEQLSIENLATIPKEGFIDLCRGGHVDSPAAEIDPKAFKLDSLAGAYWRGDQSNQQLTRIYGLAFESAAGLDKYLMQREEAKKRDHRKLGQKMGLFTFSDKVGKGLPMFLPSGNLIREILTKYITDKKTALGYQFVHIPHIAKRDLYETSGHMGKYDAMMPVMTDEDGDEYVMKAMNCPHHFELYNSLPHSYRDLPLRYAENTTVYRNEKSGELHGLTRVKALTQDDTHHFIRHSQIKSEIEMVLSLVKDVYDLFDFNSYKVEISVRDQDNKDKYFGENSIWTKTESILEESVKFWGADYTIEEGEAAFYGPKIDIKVKDSLGRQWQVATVQLDFIQPENFDMIYIDENGDKQRPAVLHVAVFGSIERFMGILIEHYAGKFPFWLSPEQVRILPIAENHINYANKINDQLIEQSIRSTIITNDSLGKRIRGAKTDLLPYFIVVGDDEVKNNTATLEGRNGSENLTVSDLIHKLATENTPSV